VILKINPYLCPQETERKNMISTVSRHTADNYWKIVKHLSPDAKIDLITMLSQSLKEKEPAKVSASKYYGVWGDDGMTDDEFISELKSLRSFNKEIVEL